MRPDGRLLKTLCIRGSPVVLHQQISVSYRDGIQIVLRARCLGAPDDMKIVAWRWGRVKKSRNRFSFFSLFSTNLPGIRRDFVKDYGGATHRFG